jgi:uncharacterized protein YijF (DUF1287 family)
VARPPAAEPPRIEEHAEEPPQIGAPLPLPGDQEGERAPAGLCVAPARAGPAQGGNREASWRGDQTQFGVHLAAAARAQLDNFVVYNDRYQQLAYPMGDVPEMFGVCTDVVVRAYRALGVDLQVLVHEARVGSGDTSIDHRRTEVLRRFFAAYGEQLAVTSFPEDYRPGDIVTYYRPQNRSSRSHIAIVSDVIAPSGRPMIVHNRGWGPQMEDALFVDQITGHYRYFGAKWLRDGERIAAQKPLRPKMASRASRVPVVKASYAPLRPAAASLGGGLRAN